MAHLKFYADESLRWPQLAGRSDMRYRDAEGRAVDIYTDMPAGRNWPGCGPAPGRGTDMANRKMQVMVYAERCARAGALVTEVELMDRAANGETDDVDIYEGTAAELEATAVRLGRKLSTYALRAARSLRSYSRGQRGRRKPQGRMNMPVKTYPVPSSHATMAAEIILLREVNAGLLRLAREVVKTHMELLASSPDQLALLRRLRFLRETARAAIAKAEGV